MARSKRDDPKLHSSPLRRSVGKIVIMAQTKLWCRFGSQALCALACVAVIISMTGGFSTSNASGGYPYSSSRAPHRISRWSRTVSKGTISIPCPRTLYYYFTEEGWAESGGPVRVDRSRRHHNADDDIIRPMSDEVEALMKPNDRRRKSGKIGALMREVPKPPCDYQYDWQKSSFPSCNVVHESFTGEPAHRVPFLINNGGWVDIFAITEHDGSMRVLKTKRYKHEFTDRNFDRYRRDALAMERLSSAPNVLNLYGFCGVTALVDYADGGDIENYIEELPDRLEEGDTEEEERIKTEKLKIASQVLSSIALMHSFDKEGQSSISHTDISPYQFIKMDDGNFVLNDFNRARLINWNTEENKPCGFNVANNPGKWRSPEEYRYDSEDEKIDVYSAGNVIYYLLTETKPFDDIDQKEAKKLVIKGGRPHLPGRFREPTHPVDIALLRAMNLCWTHDPEERPSAKLVADFLGEQLKKIAKED